MYCWPLELTPLSIGSRGAPCEAVLEIPPRGAAFTLAALSHVGHPIHLALIDAYLKGQVRATATCGIGDDSRTVAASLAAPLVAAHEIGLERLSLGDLTLLAPHGDGPHLMLRADTVWHNIRVAHDFGMAGCLGARDAGVGVPWYEVIVALPDASEGWPAPLTCEVREASLPSAAPDADTVSNLRSCALASWSGPHRTAASSARHTGPHPPTPAPASGSGGVGTPVQVSGLPKDVRAVLVPEADGYQTLRLLPPSDPDSDSVRAQMREAAWKVIEALIGRPLPERRTEPIVMRLIGENLTTTLDVGESVVIGRNQTVFAAWVGSDGRVMIRLFPPGSMSGRQHRPDPTEAS